MRLLLAYLCVLQLGATELFVAPDGKDTNAGTKSAPFATLERARDEVRALKTAGHYPADGITVRIAGGVYLRDRSFDLNEKDSGTTEAPVVYAAASGEHPRLTGGKVIPRSAFHPVTDEAFLHRLLDVIAATGRLDAAHAVAHDLRERAVGREMQLRRHRGRRQ